MNKLYYYPLCPFSRQARLYIKELNLNIELIKVSYLQLNADLLKMNAAGTLPILEDSDGLIAAGIYPLIEFLQEKYGDSELISNCAAIKAEIRRLISWCNDKMYKEVIDIIINEKLTRLLASQGSPRTDLLRIARSNLIIHMNYYTHLLAIHGYMACDNMTMADLAIASHLSILDYFGEVNWDNWSLVRNWYAIIKSRPSFRPILNDRVAGLAPPSHYDDLDF